MPATARTLYKSTKSLKPLSKCNENETISSLLFKIRKVKNKARKSINNEKNSQRTLIPGFRRKSEGRLLSQIFIPCEHIRYGFRMLPSTSIRRGQLCLRYRLNLKDRAARTFTTTSRLQKERLAILGSGWGGYQVLRSVDKKKWGVSTN